MTEARQSMPDRLGKPALGVLLGAAVVGLWLGIGLWLAGDAIVAVDFVSAYLPAARNVLDGISPFPLPTDASLDAGSRLIVVRKRDLAFSDLHHSTMLRRSGLPRSS